ncbi:hypothetical protein [Ruminococcus albus]|uniref:Uncharacterized protein n=1 Tax=Ruminococcus albus TaxID=1264 RepID=A0A1H7MBK4_RUMAL|nr:hypothetical protein [Ruminococcus albus]SEL08554.1 hypothetical protein SAMN05216469_11161 [Ruminococcus albus]
MKLNIYSWSIMNYYRLYRRALHSRSMYACRRAIEKLNELIGVISCSASLTVDERMKYIYYINELNDKAFDLFIELCNSND